MELFFILCLEIMEDPFWSVNVTRGAVPHLTRVWSITSFWNNLKEVQGLDSPVCHFLVRFWGFFSREYLWNLLSSAFDNALVTLIFKLFYFTLEIGTNRTYVIMPWSFLPKKREREHFWNELQIHGEIFRDCLFKFRADVYLTTKCHLLVHN